MFDINNDDKHRYDDMIAMERHVSPTRPRMSRKDRAAQFSPFAALSGYGAAVDETARLTEEKAELHEDGKLLVNARLQLLLDHIDEKPELLITYFKPDEKKKGGSYRALGGTIKKIDLYERRIVMTDGSTAPIDDIYSIEGDIFRELESWY